MMPNATNSTATADVVLSPSTELRSAFSSMTTSIEASACCGGCAGESNQFVYAIGEVDYDFPSLSRLNSLQHSLAVLTSTGLQLQVQNRLDFARHICGFQEHRINVNAGGMMSAAGVVAHPPYNGFLQFTTSNGDPLTQEDDGRCILVQGVMVSENSGPKKPWLYNDIPLRIGFVSANAFCILGVGYTGAQAFDFSKASWILPQHCDAKETRRHAAHRYDAGSVIWKLKRGSTNFYAIEPADSFSEDAYDELTDFLLQSLGYEREGLDIYYYGWGDSVQIWPGSWDPCFNSRDCCFAAHANLTQCCKNYQNKNHDARYRFSVAPQRLPRNLPKAQRVAIPGRIGGQSTLLNGEVLREITPDMRGTLSWSIAKLLDYVLGEISPTANANATTIRSNLTAGMQSLLQHFDRRLRNPGLTSSDRALNYAATRLQDILSDIAPELINVDPANGSVKVFELDDILAPVQNLVGPPGSDCWEVEIAFFDPNNINAARVIVAQTVDVSDVVPHLVEDPKKYRRR